MEEKYSHEIDKKWQKYWEDNKIFKTDITKSENKKYILDMFPYPSGAGLHVGHVEGYTATDIMSRYLRLRNFNVLHPIGWDAFGLPAEQFAIKTGNNPAIFTNENIKIFESQLKKLGFSYDWDRVVNTTDPAYFRNTQKIFIELYKKGLAQLKVTQVNWCEELGTVLANEEILIKDGIMVSERGEYPVIKKEMKQWVLKITHYAQRLLDDLELLDWPKSIKLMQENWIGKSQGANINFEVENLDMQVEVFTTKPETIFGVSCIVIAPEHELSKYVAKENKDVATYLEKASQKTDLQRQDLNKEKNGINTNLYAINPINQNKIPIYIADYVLNTYGTGAIMSVPAHDERDLEFSQKYNLKIIQVLENNQMVNSEQFNNLSIQEGKKQIVNWLVENKKGKVKINYKLRDWIFSRQRFWGEPFPVYHDEEGNIYLDENLPIELPKSDKIEFSKTEIAPLSNFPEWKKIEIDNKKYIREVNVMPQWAGSCWYYIGYLLKNDDGTYLDIESEEAKQRMKNWLPVDLYIGGAEHAVLHLLYARFWHKVLYDIGFIDTKEPFQKLYNQGMILADNNEKMSKSKGNVINPDDIIQKYGSDVLRLYEMFMGPLDMAKSWSNDNLMGAKRFIDRFYRLQNQNDIYDLVENSSNELNKIINETIKKVTLDFEKLNYNTAISQIMIAVNQIYKEKAISKKDLQKLIIIFYPIAPHVCSQMYMNLFNENIENKSWPKYDENVLVEEEFEYMIQINSKNKTKFKVNTSLNQDQIIQLAKEQTNILEYKKAIFIKNRLINFII